MKNIQISDEMFEKLKEFQKLMLDEYSKEVYQAKPYICLIQSKQQVLMPDDYADDTVYVGNGNRYESCDYYDLTEEYLKKMWEEEVDEDTLEKYDNDFDDWKEDNFRAVGVATEEKFENYYGITRDYARNYIEGARHHIHGEDPVTYATSPANDLRLLLTGFMEMKFN